MRMTAEEWTNQLFKLAETLKKPTKGNNIWKEECAFSFATPFSKNGLFLNLQTFQSFSEAFIGLDHDRTGNTLYLNMRFEKIKKKIEQTAEPEKLEILVDELVSVEKTFSLCIYPDTKVEQMLNLTVVEGHTASVSVQDNEVNCPESLLNLLLEVITRNDKTKENDIKNWSAEEEEENLRPISKYAENLVQVDNPPVISHDASTWKCEESGMSENLWLNLHDGYIGSGRRNWDGSGGTGAALTHFNATGNKYPLCVKLGTITPDGKADIYSYDPSEDKMVKDPYLRQHLAHFGLDMKQMKKTDKTMLEMELDLNQKHIFSAITEDGQNLKPCYGPGFVGLKNLGNTCYMNSVIQVLFKLPAFQKRFLYGNSEEVRKERMNKFIKATEEPQTDRELQMIKLASTFSDPESAENRNVEEETDGSLAVPPKLLKDCFCAEHPEFRKAAQQDSEEFFEFFITKLTELDAHGNSSVDKNDLNPSKWFSYVLEERLQCSQSQMVRYKQTSAEVLPLNIPISIHELKKVIEANKKPNKEVFLPTINFNDCLESSIGASDKAKSIMTDYLSPATGTKGVAYQTSGFKTFPKYLCVQLRRYVISEMDLSVHKLTCLVPVPTELDLGMYKSSGLQEGEVQLPEGEEPKSDNSSFDQSVQNLMGMGFPINVCKHALINNNNNADAAVGWIFENMNNPIYALAPEEQKKETPKQNNNMEKRVEEIEAENTGEGRYKLRGFVSHMGSNTASGHYVCHIYDDVLRKWVLYNDEKVAISEKPPLEHGYLYFYERQN